MSGGNDITTKELKEVEELYRSGKSDSEIAAELKVKTARVTCIRNSLGLNRNKDQLRAIRSGLVDNKENIKNVLDLINKGFTDKGIAETLELSMYVVTTIRRDNKIYYPYVYTTSKEFKEKQKEKLQYWRSFITEKFELGWSDVKMAEVLKVHTRTIRKYRQEMELYRSKHKGIKKL